MRSFSGRTDLQDKICLGLNTSLTERPRYTFDLVKEQDPSQQSMVTFYHEVEGPILSEGIITRDLMLSK